MQNLIGLLLCLALAAPAHAQELFSLFVPSDIEDVKRMLRLAQLREGDVVLDLGSGDGRIPIEAARTHPAVRGAGVEIDGKLVRESAAAAEAQGVGDRVRFIHDDVFNADLSQATVITMWLFPELMRLLRPKILAEARPGTRVITKTWDLGSWKPDRVDTDGAHIFLWVVPAAVAGYWEWQLPVGGEKRTYAALFEQAFQAVEGVVRVGNRRGIFDNVRLRGAELSFTLTMTLEGTGSTHHKFRGRVRGDRIEGAVSIARGSGEENPQLPWRAVRVRKSAYFAPTRLEPR